MALGWGIRMPSTPKHIGRVKAERSIPMDVINAESVCVWAVMGRLGGALLPDGVAAPEAVRAAGVVARETVRVAVGADVPGGTLSKESPMSNAMCVGAVR